MAGRVVITSIGVISSLGVTRDDILNSIQTDHTCFERWDLRRFGIEDDLVTCPVREFDIKSFTGRFKNARYLNRGAQFCVAAAMTAIKDAGLKKEQLSEAGLFVGTGPNLDVTNEFSGMTNGEPDPDRLQALFLLKFLPNTAASAISQIAGIHGENATLGTACSASLQAMGQAFRSIKYGDLDVALAGGGDSRLNPGALLAYHKARALHKHTGDPLSSYAPFDVSRNGFVPGEGGAFFVLENLDHALKRNAAIYGEICGFGSSMDGYTMTAPAPEGKWGEKAVRKALGEALLAPEAVQVVAAHGTGTLLNDAMESELIQRVYQIGGGIGRRPVVVALKSWIGHLAAGCGAVEAAILLHLMNAGVMPKIRNLKEPCHETLNFVTRNQSVSMKTAVVESFGFGGQNSAIVIEKWMS